MLIQDQIGLELKPHDHLFVVMSGGMVWLVLVTSRGLVVIGTCSKMCIDVCRCVENKTIQDDSGITNN